MNLSLVEKISIEMNNPDKLIPIFTYHRYHENQHTRPTAILAEGPIYEKGAMKSKKVKKAGAGGYSFRSQSQSIFRQNPEAADVSPRQSRTQI